MPLSPLLTSQIPSRLTSTASTKYCTYEQLDKIVPRKARKPREGSHWWTPELSSMREELKHPLAQKKNPIMAERLRLVRRSYSSLICKEKSNSWRSFLHEGRSSQEDQHFGANNRQRQGKMTQPAQAGGHLHHLGGKVTELPPKASIPPAPHPSGRGAIKGGGGKIYKL